MSSQANFLPALSLTNPPFPTSGLNLSHSIWRSAFPALLINCKYSGQTTSLVSQNHAGSTNYRDQDLLPGGTSHWTVRLPRKCIDNIASTAYANCVLQLFAATTRLGVAGGYEGQRLTRGVCRGPPPPSLRKGRAQYNFVYTTIDTMNRTKMWSSGLPPCSPELLHIVNGLGTLGLATN